MKTQPVRAQLLPDPVCDNAAGVVVKGYRLRAKLDETPATVVWRAEREHDGLPVILKILQETRSGKADALRYQHEHALLGTLKLRGSARCFGLENVGDTWMLVLEDIGGTSLKALLESRAFPLPQALGLAIQLTDALSEIHAAQIIHKDINPANIVVNLETGALRIIDFSLATALPREQAAIASAHTLEGTLAYISPEQTGRMNRAIDYRSDYYSLGVTLYELFTGQRPFNAKAPLELVHQHVARQPAPLWEAKAGIPRALSDIVLRLLAKTAEQRYQSAQGLKADLEECLAQLTRSARIEPFVLGRQDISDRFQIPQKLYGREAEIRQMLELFARASAGSRKVLLVTGQPGIGKSSLVREIHKPITERSGYFLSGKFDQLQRVPYQGVLGVFRELVRQLLTESEEHLLAWRQKLQEAFGPNGRIITELIPDVELIIGPQPPVAVLDRIQAQKRFNRLFRDFIRLFCRAEHPLVIYLDDLQWADAESLQLIVNIWRDPQIRHLLLIGAYRDNEVQGGHPLSFALEELRSEGVTPYRIALAPLGLEQVRELIADALRSSGAQVEPLAALVLTKTAGNPFFTEEFLKSLYTENLLAFDRTAAAWQWDLAQIVARDITDNVVDLMTAKLRRLPAAAQRVLQLAACMGAQFELQALAVATQQPPAQAARSLAEAIEEGVILPIGAQHRYVGLRDAGELKVEYRFSHDRVQQAAYGLIPPEAKAAAHYQIGKRLLVSVSPEKLEESPFAIVNHLNVGAGLIGSDAEKLALARLNLQAGKKAKASTAYAAASSYFELGIEVLGEDGWARHHPDLLALHAQAAEAASLQGRFEEMERFVDTGLRQARSLIDKVPFYEIQIVSELAQGRLQPMLKTALRVLRMLAVDLPDTPRWWHQLGALLYTRHLARLTAKRDLSALPVMQDPRALAAMRILPLVLNAAFWVKPALLPLAVGAMARLSIKHGNAPASAYGYVIYAMVVCGFLHDYELGFRLGELAMSALERSDAKEQRARTISLFAGAVRHHKEHLRDTLPQITEAYQLALESGDGVSAGSCLVIHAMHTVYGGKELSSLYEELCRHGDVVATLGQNPSTHINRIYRQFARNLMGKYEHPTRLKGECFDEAAIPALIEAKEGPALHSVYIVKTMLNYIFGDYAQAVACTDARGAYARNTPSMAVVAPAEFYDSLSRLAVYPSAGEAQQKAIRKRVKQNLKSLERRARHAPMNHRHKFLLVQAELARVLGKELVAIALYDQAIAAAGESGYVQEQAIANELAAKFHLGRERAHFAVHYLREARRLYARWGASAKVAAMEAEHPSLRSARETQEPSVSFTHSISHSIAQRDVDLHALMQVLKNIAEEKIYSKLLEKTMRAAMEFAGAQHGLLLLRRGKDELFVEAESSIEKDGVTVLRSIPFEQAGNLSKTVVNYVRRTRESVVIANALEPQGVLPQLHADAYVREHQVRSILCIPFRTGAGADAELIGLLYVENNAATNAFTDHRLETLEIICLSAAGRLELSREAVTDSLTGLYNHNYFQNVLRKEISLALRKHRPLSMVMVDIDHFKKFNDTWGHQLGDAVLKSVSGTLKTSCRQTDVIARYGGEEMAIILPETDAAAALEVAERMRRCIDDIRVEHDGEALKVTVSLGIATLRPDMAEAALLIKAADDALYRSKADGRNRCSVAGAAATARFELSC